MAVTQRPAVRPPATRQQGFEADYLQGQQQDVADEQNRLGSVLPFGGRGPLGAPKSQFLSQQSYTSNLNNQGQLANLSSQLAGKGPARVIGGGTMPGPATRSLARANGDDEDPLARSYAESQDDLLRQQVLAGREGLMETNRQRANQAVGALYTPENDLYTGRTAARARAQGDIARIQGDIGRGEFERDEATKRAQIVPEARERGQAEAEKYGAFGQPEARRQQFRDLRVRAPYTPSAMGALARYPGQVYTGDSRVAANAVSAAGRMGSNLMATPEERNLYGGAVLENVPGQQPELRPDMMQVFPAAQLDDWAQQQGFTPDQAREYLRTQGYDVR